MCHIRELFKEPSQFHINLYVLFPDNVYYLGMLTVSRPCNHRGAGVTSILFFSTLKKIHAIQIEKDKTDKKGDEGVE